jgi:hypothetical protein
MKATSRGERHAARVFGILLRIYPRRFRERHGGAMAATFLEAWRASGRGFATRTPFWAAAVADALREGLAERLARPSNPLHSDRREGLAPALAVDLRLAIRTLGRSPGFSVLVVATLALGIGANVAILSLVDAVLLRPLPVREPERLVEVFEALNDRGVPGGLAYVTYERLQAADPGVGTLAAWLDDEVELHVEGVPSAGTITLASGRYFEVMGVNAVLGRTLGPADDANWGDGRVAVLSNRLWQGAFGGRRDAIGATLRIAGTPVTVVGVAPIAPDSRSPARWRRRVPSPWCPPWRPRLPPTEGISSGSSSCWPAWWR